MTLDELRSAGSWSGITASVGGVPPVALTPDAGTIGDLATATAGFRDQFYGLAPFVRGTQAGTDEARLMTSGLIEPLRSLWGHQATRFAGGRWQAPVVDLTQLRTDGDVALASWVEARLVPKLIVATQTRVLEVVVDEAGAWVPSVPTIAVTADPEHLWALAAVIGSPPVSAWALRGHRGAALSDDAIKLSAKQILTIPLPPDEGAWASATIPLRVAAHAADRQDEDRWTAAMAAFGYLMTGAYGISGAAAEEVVEWWLGRLRPWRRTSGA